MHSGCVKKQSRAEQSRAERREWNICIIFPKINFQVWCYMKRNQALPLNFAVNAIFVFRILLLFCVCRKTARIGICAARKVCVMCIETLTWVEAYFCTFECFMHMGETPFFGVSVFDCFRGKQEKKIVWKKNRPKEKKTRINFCCCCCCRGRRCRRFRYF